MRLSKLVGRRIKEDPKDAKTVSHKFLVRGGYVRPVSAGIYSLLPTGKRVIEKIEQIIREEMNKIDGQEVLMPVVLPAELWEESGRYASVGAELLRFRDRNNKPMILGMTHEEAVVHLARTELTSYKQLPAMLYQIQTKYRDEARPRAGLIRVREFTMKDAYSFHTDQADLEKYYKRCHEAYERIFQRLGMKNVLSIEANSGMMGGAVSHEFMALCDCGEDTIFYSPDRSYRANREVAKANWKFEKPAETLPLEKVHTPNCKTIEEVADFLQVKAENTGKVVFYQNAITGELICALIRGDFEVNESKLANAAMAPELKFADDESIRNAGCVPGFASIIGIDPKKMKMIVDRSAAESGNLVVGANEADYHYINFNYERDCDTTASIVTDIATVREGDPCPLTGEPLKMERGIEVGNIFQLGTKYSKPMGCNYLDVNGKSNPMIMGCYGIGVGRAMASVIEQSCDEYGPIWPISIAPWQVEIVAIGYDKEDVKTAADKLYSDLTAAGVEVLFDDRGEKPGFMFSDADLLGIPFRVVVSPKTLAENCAEFRRRDCRDAERIALDTVNTVVTDAVNKEMALYKSDCTMWNYNEKVMDHFLNPRNVGEVENPDGVGDVGNITCGDALKLTFKLDENGRIADVKFKTFGCASAIASSSALTELVKGMTLEEASKVTNQDIVALLGELPEAKMHCSVMGMEALQAAIANYRGEEVADNGDDHEGAIICKCFGVTDTKIRNVAKQNNLHKASEITNFCKAGGACGSCLDEIQRVLDELWNNAPAGKAAPKLDDFNKLTTVQKVFRVQEVIDKEIRPLLEHDGGSIELVDLNGSNVIVRLTGRCSSCPSAGVTLKYTVQDKLREFVSSDLTVESI